MVTKISSQKDLPKLKTQFFMDSQGNRKTINLGALEFNHVLSPSGEYLFVQLCNSKSEDSGAFIKIDVATGEKLYSVLPEWGWANRYEFINGDNITVVTNNYGSYELDDMGSLVNRAEYYTSRVKSADHGTMSALPEFFKLHGNNAQNYDLAIESIDLFLKTCFSMFHGISWAVSALKSKAEVLGFRDEYESAQQCCVDALFLDSKAPVKRMLNNFSRKSSVDKETIEPSQWVKKLKVSVESVRTNEMNKSKDNYKELNEKQNVIITKEMKLSTSQHTPVNRNKMIIFGFILVVVFFIWVSK
ncbi:TPA: hypothetical protein SK292_002497 [Yersinia enterocolitica]|nr:hypothetical protein [Yersinia enterocolitica]